MITVTTIPILKDNYAYLIETPDGTTAIVDPGEEKPIIEFLKKKSLKLDYILNTHHHGDHTAGNIPLKNYYDCKVIGPAADKHRIPAIDQGLKEGDDFSLGNEKIGILETPGHTSDSICIYFPESRTLFTGDTLFSLGCGRVIEGTMEQMFNSIRKISNLPDDTMIYCGHEYTQANGKFCLSIIPDNAVLQERIKEIETLRLQNRPTIPVSLQTEKQTNVFFNTKTAQDFEVLRRAKDKF